MAEKSLDLDLSNNRQTSHWEVWSRRWGRGDAIVSVQTSGGTWTSPPLWFSLSISFL